MKFYVEVRCNGGFMLSSAQARLRVTGSSTSTKRSVILNSFIPMLIIDIHLQNLHGYTEYYILGPNIVFIAATNLRWSWTIAYIITIHHKTPWPAWPHRTIYSVVDALIACLWPVLGWQGSPLSHPWAALHDNRDLCYKDPTVCATLCMLLQCPHNNNLLFPHFLIEQ